MFGIGLPELLIIFIMFFIPIGGILLFLLISSNSKKKNISRILEKKMEVPMSYCTKCGKEVLESSSFCKYCGEKLSAAKSSINAPSTSLGLTEEDFAIFVGNNSEEYLEKFAKFNLRGMESFTVTWHWPAFFVPFWWMLYRKMYGWAVLAFFLGIIPYFGWFIIPFVFGMTANYIYFKQARKKILEIKQLYPSPDTQKAIITVTGGTGSAGLIIGAIIGGIAMIGILAAIAIPQFIQYRARGYCAAARSELKEAYTAAQTFYADHPNTNISNIQQLFEAYGSLKQNKDINLKIISGGFNDLIISSKHSGCEKTYYVDYNGSISEELPTPAPAPYPAPTPPAPEPAPYPPPAPAPIK